MNTDHLQRHIDLIPLEVLGEKITIIGAGAIGSFTALQLAKLGFTELTVYDSDVVSIENMNSQFYRFKDIGAPKVLALQNLIEDFTNVKIDIVNGFYDSGTFQGLVIVAVDNMAARKLLFENHELKSPKTKYILDPRMGAETAVMHVYNPMAEKETANYRKTLFGDSEAIEERCTAKSTMYTVNLLSGLICKTVKDIALGHSFLKNVSWDIKTFALQAWNREGMNPNFTPPKNIPVPTQNSTIGTGPTSVQSLRQTYGTVNAGLYRTLRPGRVNEVPPPTEELEEVDRIPLESLGYPRGRFEAPEDGLYSIEYAAFDPARSRWLEIPAGHTLPLMGEVERIRGWKILSDEGRVYRRMQQEMLRTHTGSWISASTPIGEETVYQYQTTEGLASGISQDRFFVSDATGSGIVYRQQQAQQQHATHLAAHQQEINRLASQVRESQRILGESSIYGSAEVRLPAQIVSENGITYVVDEIPDGSGNT